ncbi:MAG TPA: error-prone DNA polymerase, partial [Alphaproteobacteria bacterium]
MVAYAELQVTTNFSFLRGASHPQELVHAAAALGHAAIAVTDRNSLAGVVRAHAAAKQAGIRLVVGARLEVTDGPSALCLPTNRAAYARLARLLTLGKRRTVKGQCELAWADVEAHAEGQVLVVLPPEAGLPDGAFAEHLAAIARRHPGRSYLAASCRFAGEDAARLAVLDALAAACATPLVATGDVLYHHPGRRRLADVLACIREHCTIDEAGLRLAANAERYLKPGTEMARLFAHYPNAIARTVEIADACQFSLDELAYDYPDEVVPAGEGAQSWLATLVAEGAAARYPHAVPEKVRAQLDHELKLIGELAYAPYFLTVHDIVRFANSRAILCQGRGSAANSAVCYCLGITAVDPERNDVLFERFVSAARNEPPDIDVDFEHERREEVIQYVYAKYGRDRVGLTATVISYRARSAIREVGKALGLSVDMVGALARGIWGWSREGLDEEQVRELGLDPGEGRLALALELAGELIGFPRHLSQHVGGFVITRGLLSEMVPIENAAMADRTVIEWDKDDIDALGMLKVDVLGLGMLTCIRKAFALIARHHGRALSLATVPGEDPAVYDMLCRADSIGTFQVESRAQMSMLPRLKPRCFYDLVIEVAIVRPGPIQGDMVHPYLRRRNGEERVDYPSEELERVLGKTLGVPLFQEQAMRIAVVAAGFTPAEADQLRRAMATFRKTGIIHTFRRKLVDGMVARGYEAAFAERCFNQIEGFGEYGFPESHA